ncbi:MAG: hypothetical protein Q4C70_03785, partial [Planctomycetia bacterium]|nr:hypothetical protein [Planctomycetia bacterium]
NEDGTTTDLTVRASGCQGAYARLYDWNGDGQSDLLVGLSDGTIQLFYNVTENGNIAEGTAENETGGITETTTETT